MRRSLVLLALLSSCGGGQPPARGPEGPVRFRVLSERQNPAFCVEGPDFAVAVTEDDWIDIFDRQTECQPGGEVELPRLDVGREVGVAAWWRVQGCLGFTLRSTSVERRGAEVVLRATSTGPGEGEACATARGGLESFLALGRSALFDGTQPVRFVLDGATVGTARPT